VDVEDRSLEHAEKRCQECGARLTPGEIRAVLESGAPSLCNVHSAEVVPVAEEESDFDRGLD
jgi:hypothetical protein